MTVRILPRRHAVAAAAIVATLALSTACTPTNNPGGPTTTASSNSTGTTPSATPTPTPTPTPSLPTEADKKAAIESFTKLNFLLDDAFINREKTLPKEVELYLDPNSEMYREQASGLDESNVVGWHITARTTIVEITADALPDMTIDLFACIDARQVTINYPDIGPKPGVLTAGHLTMKKSGTHWRVISYGTPRLDEVKSCEDGK